ncbi:hypothetical protein GCM10023231_06900 [Olivibacter ginsenosidimutans]|uniref:TM2 domain-containing protein n=1 Tax=Olivibacter ginsenosidimutans TaxID=1176537 RepID=A0ABP9AIF5_9SPHI
MSEQKILMSVSDVTPEEMLFLVNATKGLTENQVDQFLFLYTGKRRKTQEILLLTLVGFLGVAGIQRFMIKQVGMGIVFFLTAGFCGIGTIVDLVNHRNLTESFNQKMAIECLQMVRMYSKPRA